MPLVRQFALGTVVTDSDGWVATIVKVNSKSYRLDYGQGDTATVPEASVSKYRAPRKPTAPKQPTPTAVITERNGEVHVNIEWIGVALDRPNTGGWLVKDMKMANRLAKAIEAGVAVKYEGIEKDVAGKTYVNYRSVVSGRMMNADLNRLGF